MAFLEECGNYDDRLKLIAEIARLHRQNEAIHKMTLEDAKQDSNDYTIRIGSRMNASRAGGKLFENLNRNE